MSYETKPGTKDNVDKTVKKNLKKRVNKNKFNYLITLSKI